MTSEKMNGIERIMQRIKRGEIELRLAGWVYFYGILSDGPDEEDLGADIYVTSRGSVAAIGTWGSVKVFPSATQAEDYVRKKIKQLLVR